MKKTIEKIIAILVLLSLSACTLKEQYNRDYTTMSEVAAKKPYVYVFDAFDTTCSFSIYGVNDDEVCEEISQDLCNAVRQFEKTFSKTIEGSDIYEINHRTGDSVMITDITANIFEIAKGLYDWSDGKFDISSGTLVDLWDVKNRKTLPTLSEINEARSHCGNFNYVIEHDVDEEYVKCNRITFSGDKKTRYDLGALGKGYCCDTLKNMILDIDLIKACIINLGGNVCCVGKVEGRKDGAFNVGIFKPFSGNEIIDTVKVVDRNVITSGNYQRYFKVDGGDRVYHHIIDPTTGYPTDNGLSSVTIISENGLLGDYLSTACMLIGIDKSSKLIDFCKKNFEDNNIQATFVTSENEVTKYPKKVKTY